MADETTEIVQTLRRSAIRRLRYSGRRGARRLADVLDARDWEHRVMHLVGTEFCGNYDPPNAGTVRYPWMDEERVFSADNDGMELWFGYPSRWEWHIDSDEVRRLTRFLIVDWWIKARWLGLRRPIYYAALRSSVKRHKAKRDNTPAQTDPKEVGRG